jgi:hypothetical protein
MFKLLNQFCLNGKNGYIYKRQSCLYYSELDLGREIEADKSLIPIGKGLTLAQFLLELQ